jgi:uncharacterized protein
MARELASSIASESRPLSAQVHLVRGAGQPQLLVTNGSRLYRLDPQHYPEWQRLLEQGDEAGIEKRLREQGLQAPAYIDDQPLKSPKVHALSLAIAQKCNLGCQYCYAGQGQFGETAKNMPLEKAFRSVELLLTDCAPGSTIQLAFMGGEPLLNRAALRETTEYAYARAAAKEVKLNFSVTTNGTLLTAEDARFFEEYGFSVTVSLDGLREEHDRQRPTKGGKGSYDTILKNIQPLLGLQRKMQVAARVTVTPMNSRLARTLDEFIDMGFHSVGFSPLLRANDGNREMDGAQLQELLQEMIECGLKFEQAVLAGRRYPFLNMLNALKEIAKGTHRPYPCGAGAGYMGVSADGELAACHRFVNEPRGRMGHIDTGVDTGLQNTWLATRHVHLQSPCNGCWARYLCGGGCHHEVLEKGRGACDYIRGWLHYTIQAHERITRLVPDWNR